MKDQDLFSNDGSPPIEPQNAPSSTASPPMEPGLAPGHHVRLLLVALVVLIILAGGYGIFRAVSPPPPQTSSAFQQAHCPFTLGQGLVEGKDVRCGFVVVPEDRSQPKSHPIRLAVAIFKTPNPHPAPDPVLLLGGGPGLLLLATEGPSITARNLSSYAPNRDLILLDQRGVGYSQPSLIIQPLNPMRVASAACQNQPLRNCSSWIKHE